MKEYQTQQSRPSINFQTNHMLQLGKPAYIQDLSEEIIAGNINGLDKYGYRLLPLAAHNPGLWVHNVEDSQYVREYLQYLENVTGIRNQIQTLGIELKHKSLTQAAIQNLDKIQIFNCESMIPFIMSASSQQIAESLNLQTFESHNQSETLNNKGIFLEMCRQKGIKTPYGSMFRNQTQAWEIFEELASRGASAFYSKLSRSASGQGITQFNFQEQKLKEIFTSYLNDPDTITNMEQYGIRMDEAILFEDSPAIVFWMCPHNGLRIVNSNYQILAKKDDADETEINPTVHKGAKGPLENSDLEELAFTLQKLEEILEETQSYGPGSIDLITRRDPKTDKKEFFVVELNKRITGGYHNYLSSYFGFEHFRSDCNLYCPSNISFQNLIQHLQENNLLWTQGKTSGTFVVNYQTAPVHEKIATISFGQSPSHAEEIYIATKDVIASI